MAQRNIIVEERRELPIELQMSELVERKGIGHPDSIADGAAEAISRELSKEYIKRTGRILHHNTDKLQIAAGKSYPKFGGGEVVKPILFTIAGRATDCITDASGNPDYIPARPIALAAVLRYLEQFRHLDIHRHLVVDCKIGPGSDDLIGVFKSSLEVPLANDTSFGVGYAPFSETEQIVLQTEKYINGALKSRLPEIGEDVKIMGIRNGNKITVTVAAAMISPLIPDADHYKNIKEELHDSVADHITGLTKREVDINVNTADDYDKDIYYLTVTGLDMENGDDGAVGRGNRVNGLITPYRPMSLEAAAGKNPLNHIGKIYNVMAVKITEKIIQECKGDVAEAYIRLLAQIGKPIDEPKLASIQLKMADGVPLSKAEKEAAAIAEEWLANPKNITDLIVQGRANVF